MTNDEVLLRESWDLQPDTKIISAGPNELLIEIRTGDRRRVSMACPAEFDRLAAECQQLKETLSAYKEATGIVQDVAYADELNRANARLAAELAAVRQSLDSAHDWLTEAVGDYCKPAADEPIETVAEQLRLRCESAAKRLTEAKAMEAKP